MQCTYKVTPRRVRSTIVAVEVLHIVSVCVCLDLGIQHAMRMLRN